MTLNQFYNNLVNYEVIINLRLKFLIIYINKLKIYN